GVASHGHHCRAVLVFADKCIELFRLQADSIVLEPRCSKRITTLRVARRSDCPLLVPNKGDLRVSHLPEELIRRTRENAMFRLPGELREQCIAFDRYGHDRPLVIDT